MKWTHDALVAELRTLAKRVQLKRAADAFVASLGGDETHRPALICALLALRIPAHPFDASRYRGEACGVCGCEPTWTADEEHEAGAKTTVLPGSVPHAVTYLRAWLERPPAEPTAANRAVLASVLRLVGDLPDTAGEAKLNAAMATARLGLGGKYARRFVLETLGYASVLVPPDRTGLLEGWVPFPARDDRPSMRVEIDAPLGFWRAAHGVNLRAVKKLFADVPIPKAAHPRPSATVVSKSKPRKVVTTALVPGDVLEIRAEGSVFHVVVSDLRRSPTRVSAVVARIDVPSGGDPRTATVTPHEALVSRMLKQSDPRLGYVHIGRRDDVKPIRVSRVVVRFPAELPRVWASTALHAMANRVPATRDEAETP
jgi:hypothetical protein